MQEDSALGKVLIWEHRCLISSTHPGQASPALGGKPSYPFTCGQAFCGLESSEKGYGEGEPASHVCLSRSLLGLLYFKANSCLFCLNVVCFFFSKGVGNLSWFSHPCWDLRSSPHFTTWSWQAPLVEIQTEATWWGNRHKNINLVDIKKNHTGYKSGAVHWFLSSSKWSF